MNTARMQFFSDGLGKHVTYNVVLPDNGEGPFPVLFQLHGLTDDSDAWIQRSNIALHASGYPFIIAFPDGGTHFYTNWRSSGRLGKANYEDLIIADISNHLRKFFPVTDGPWAIGGLSMGGFGSLKLGLKHADRFASIWAHSSKVDWRDTELDTSLLAQPEDIDLLAHARRAMASERPPVLSFDCGTEDELIEENRWLHRELDAMGYEHHYAEHPGGHTCSWAYRRLPLASWTASEVEALVA